MRAPIPTNESERIEALRAYAILDTPPESAFDDLVQLAAHICEAPMAAMSLIDAERQWFKARLGIKAAETSRDNAFCAHGITHDEDLLIVPDARQDPRFAQMPLVQDDPKIQFYAGARLNSSEGLAMGMLCVMDKIPRVLKERQTAALRMLARQVVAQMELHRELAAHQRSRELLEVRQGELRASEALFHSLVENLPLFILRKDNEGRITFANQLLCDALQRTPAEMIGCTDFDLLPGDIAARFRSFDRRALLSGKAVESMEEIPIDGGQTMTIHVTTLPLFDHKGAASGVQVIARDFTERRRLEMELIGAREELEDRVRNRTMQLEEANALLRRMEKEASEWKTRYDLVVGSAGLAVYDLDRATGEMIWNAGAETVLGPDALGVTRGTEGWLDLVHPQDQDSVRKAIVSAMNSGTSFDLQYRMRHSFEHYRWFQDRGIVVSDADGRCSRLLGLMQDITQRKLAEDTMREQAKLLDQSQDAIMVRDLKNHVLYWNRAAQRMYGWSYGEALGRPVQDLLLRGELAHIPEAQAIAMEKGEWCGEVHVYTKEGRQLVINSRWTLLRDGDGKPHSFLVTHTNLTEQKLLEAKFLRAQRLESVGALASGIAHDLNNVFTPILMSAQLLGGELDTTTRANMVGILNNAARRGSEMVKQVLSFARGSGEGSGLVHLKHLIDELEAMVRDTFPPGIRIEKNIAPDLQLVRGDATQLYQVLMNLCVNARDAMPNGGVLRLEAKNLELDPAVDGASRGDRRGPHVCVAVSDTGSGIAPELQPKIFEPFFTTKEAGKGTGLGLSTVVSLVKAHKGLIEMESAVGAGTKFKIILPAERTQTFATTPPVVPVASGNGGLILVIDDEASIREIVKTILEAQGYDIVLAANGSLAIEIYKQRRNEIDLIITDIAMPVMDGFATIRELKRINASVKIVAVSGIADPKSLDPLDAEDVILLKKPYSLDSLLNAIEGSLRPATQEQSIPDEVEAS